MLRFNGTPASASERMLMIWFSLNRERFIEESPWLIVPENSTYDWSYFRGWLPTLTEFVVRRALAAEDTGLAGLYPGNPKQQTQRPTTERLLAAFAHITLSSIQLPGQNIVHIAPLTPLQCRILELLDLPTSIYTDLAVNVLPNPP